MNQKDSCCPPKADESCVPKEALSCCPPNEASDEDCCPPTTRIPEETQECCPPQTDKQTCCPPPASRLKPGYKLESFVKDWLSTPVGEVPVVGRKLNRSDTLGRFAMRWGIGRDHYTITPGLYAIGSPDENSDVLISANYKLSFDLLRRALCGINAWILVIDTKGVNVWCAAGKGTFGTQEIIRSVERVKLKKLVQHKRIIVPQLGAPGVSAHLVKKGCGFRVVYGPVRAIDLPKFLGTNLQATEEMRTVHFTLLDRTILTPVEITILRRQILYVALTLLVLGGVGPQIFDFTAAWTRGGGAIVAGISGLLAGAVITPILLPWLPGRAFSLKGIWPGLAGAILLGGSLFADAGTLNHLALLLQVTAIASFTAMNFTGSSTYTSPSGVEKEMRVAIPCQLVASISALSLWLWAAF